MRVVKQRGAVGAAALVAAALSLPAHTRSGDAVAISGYLGSSDRFDRAVAGFAEAYADQSEADYAAFRRARGSPAGDAGRGGSANQRKGAEG